MEESAITTEALLEIMNNHLQIIDKEAKEIADFKEKVDYLLRQKRGAKTTPPVLQLHKFCQDKTLSVSYYSRRNNTPSFK